MGNWRNWLLPLLACLAVVCLAILPARLSVLGDRTLSGTVHAEELGEDSGFPARPPELPGRLWLLAQLESWPDSLAIVGQELESEELEALLPEIQRELEALEAAGVLPEGCLEGLGSFTGSRIYLRDQRDLSSAGFLELCSYHKEQGEYLALYLDRETGRTAALQLESRLPRKLGMDPEEAGRAFLSRLGAACELAAAGEAYDAPYDSALFRLTESRVLYEVQVLNQILEIRPQPDWAALEPEDGAIYDIAYGLETG